MTETEMNVCFEAALLQRSSSERQGMQDAPGACWSQGRSCSYHQWKFGSMKRHVKVKLVLSQSLNTLLPYELLCALTPAFERASEV